MKLSIHNAFAAILLGSFLACAFGAVWAGDALPKPGHHLFVDYEGKVWAWGENSFGQLGSDTPAAAKLPLPVTLSAPVLAVAVGGRHSVAVDNFGTVWVWGDNSAGQLGTGDFKSSAKPLQLGLSGVVAVAAGAWHTVALDKTGQVWTWGGNSLGQLGDGKSGQFALSPVPRKVDGLSDVLSISSGDHHVLVLRADGSVWSWGGNTHGQLGDGQRALRDRPWRLAGLAKIHLIGGQGNASYAVGSDGKAWAWGDLPASQEAWLTPHGVASAPPDVTPVAISISGRVVAKGLPVSGAEVSIAGQTCDHTDDQGRYRCLLPEGFEGMLQAHREGIDFVARKISPIAVPLIDQDLQGRTSLVKISGWVRGKNRLPAPGATLAGDDAKCGKADAKGIFSCEVPYGWSGRLIGRGVDGSVSAPLALNRIVRATRGAVVQLKAIPLAVAANVVKPPSKALSVPTGLAAGTTTVGMDKSKVVAPAPKQAPKPDVKAEPASESAAEPKKNVLPPANVHISGNVNLSGIGLLGLAAQFVGGVSIAGDGALCSNTDSKGAFSCVVPAGWSGRLVPAKRSYRFSPYAMAFKDVREDRPHQDFVVYFEPN